MTDMPMKQAWDSVKPTIQAVRSSLGLLINMPVYTKLITKYVNLKKIIDYANEPYMWVQIKRTQFDDNYPKTYQGLMFIKNTVFVCAVSTFFSISSLSLSAPMALAISTIGASYVGLTNYNAANSKKNKEKLDNLKMENDLLVSYHITYPDFFINFKEECPNIKGTQYWDYSKVNLKKTSFYTKVKELGFVKIISNINLVRELMELALATTTGKIWNPIKMLGFTLISDGSLSVMVVGLIKVASITGNLINSVNSLHAIEDLQKVVNHRKSALLSGEAKYDHTIGDFVRKPLYDTTDELREHVFGLKKAYYNALKKHRPELFLPALKKDKAFYEMWQKNQAVKGGVVAADAQMVTSPEPEVPVTVTQAVLQEVVAPQVTVSTSVSELKTTVTLTEDTKAVVSELLVRPQVVTSLAPEVPVIVTKSISQGNEVLETAFSPATSESKATSPSNQVVPTEPQVISSVDSLQVSAVPVIVTKSLSQVNEAPETAFSPTTAKSKATSPSNQVVPTEPQVISSVDSLQVSAVPVIVTKSLSQGNEVPQITTFSPATAESKATSPDNSTQVVAVEQQVKTQDVKSLEPEVPVTKKQAVEQKNVASNLRQRRAPTFGTSVTVNEHDNVLVDEAEIVLDTDFELFIKDITKDIGTSNTAARGISKKDTSEAKTVSSKDEDEKENNSSIDLIDKKELEGYTPPPVSYVSRITNFFGRSRS
jgi:hypothetical protein